MFDWMLKGCGGGVVVEVDASIEKERAMLSSQEDNGAVCTGTGSLSNKHSNLHACEANRVKSIYLQTSTLGRAVYNFSA